MFSGLLVFIGHFFEEISASASKIAFKERVFSYTMYGFLAHVVTACFFAVTVLFEKQPFVYNTAALPLFAVRLVAELLQCEIVYRALVKSDRTTFGFARILTIPLLLLVDIMLGYQLSNAQFAGIGIIAAALLAYFGTGHVKGKGMYLALYSSVLSVVTISIFKYDVSHYNTPGVVQLLASLAVAIIYGVRVLCSKHDRKLLGHMKDHPLLGLTLLAQAASSALISYAYALAPASLVLALSRASAVIWSLISGVFYFHEHKVVRKAFVCAVLAVGLLVMVNGNM